MLDGGLGFALGAVETPLVHGVARLASVLYGGGSFDELVELLGPEPEGDGPERAAWLLDRAWVSWLNFSPFQAEQFQERALALHRVFRVRGTAGTRLLALCAPGGLMVNAPLDFLAGPGGVQLDLAFTGADGAVPPLLPEHDVALVAVSESAPAALAGLAGVFGAWPRPILNDPECVRPMSRTWLPERLASLPGLLVPAAREVAVAELRDDWRTLLPCGAWPLLLRPMGSHAGHGLVRVDGPVAAARFAADTREERFTLTQFVDYRGRSGWYAKYRIAFVGGQAFICHMASSEHWMVHYLNAGMEDDPAKRAAEAAAMAGFAGFRRRHRVALDAIVEAIGLDYFSIDCAEAPDGRLLVFEADTAAIIHSMDPPELFPYKPAAMQRCYDAFGRMIRGLAVG